MDNLLADIFIRAIATGEIQASFSGIDRTVAEVIEGICFQALSRIKTIIEDDTLDDPDCFYKIEEIVCVLEEIGSGGGTRHDFG